MRCSATTWRHAWAPAAAAAAAALITVVVVVYAVAAVEGSMAGRGEIRQQLLSVCVLMDTQIDSLDPPRGLHTAAAAMLFLEVTVNQGDLAQAVVDARRCPPSSPLPHASPPPWALMHTHTPCASADARTSARRNSFQTRSQVRYCTVRTANI